MEENIKVYGPRLFGLCMTLCKNKEDGIVYKIDTSDLRIKRYIDNEIVKVGDVVIVKYNGEISEDNYVTGAYSINKGTLVESEPVILE